MYNLICQCYLWDIRKIALVVFGMMYIFQCFVNRTEGSGVDIRHLFLPCIARGISLKGPVRSWYYCMSNKSEWVELSMWPSGITLALRNEGHWLDLWEMLRHRLLLVSYFLPKTMRQSSKIVLLMVYLFCLNHGGQKGAAAGSILHPELNFETRPSHLMLFVASLRSTLRRHHWIKSGQSTPPWSWPDGRGSYSSRFFAIC